MRFLLAALLILATGCPGALQDRAASEDDEGGNGSGSGGQGGLAAECNEARDCVAAGPKCCDCPTHAVPVFDPAQMACDNVDCPPPSNCGSPMEAACVSGKCELVCSPVPAVMSCGDGFATDDNGCLVDGCAVASAGECSNDSQCARVNADCCGCEMGGNDTSVPSSQVNAWEAMLMCTTNPSCPGVNTCEAGLAPYCVSGECVLAGPLPANACGRADLPPCPANEACTLNANEQATQQGVGVCLPSP